jgi:hypothetical protein
MSYCPVCDGLPESMEPYRAHMNPVPSAPESTYPQRLAAMAHIITCGADSCCAAVLLARAMEHAFQCDSDGKSTLDRKRAAAMGRYLNHVGRHIEPIGEPIGDYGGPGLSWQQKRTEAAVRERRELRHDADPE